MSMAILAAQGSAPDAADEASRLRDELPELLTAEEAARLLRVRKAWVYAHARELGGWRLLGEQGPWRFSRRRLLEEGGPDTDTRSTRSAPRGGRRGATKDRPASLLPIKKRPV
jgi:hypothetical protein